LPLSRLICYAVSNKFIRSSSKFLFLFNRTNESNGHWSPNGCEVLTSSASETTCHCNHLTRLAVLVDLHEYHPDPILEILSIVCSALSMLSLLLTLIVFNSLRKRKIKIDSDRTLIGINCCLCLFIAHGLIVTVLDKKFFNLSDVSLFCYYVHSGFAPTALNFFCIRKLFGTHCPMQYLKITTGAPLHVICHLKCPSGCLGSPLQDLFS